MFGLTRELVLGSGDLGNAVLLDDDREALVATWNSAQEVSFRVFGLNQPGDVRLSLTTRPGTDRVALWKLPS